jgi:hypothetical protein
MKMSKKLEISKEELALTSAVLNRYYTAMLQAAIMGLIQFVSFTEKQIHDMVDDMLKQLREAREFNMRFLT